MLNLLPWREQQQTKQKRIIIGSCAAALIFGGSSVFAWQNVVSHQIRNQIGQQQKLQQQLTVLKQKYPEIKATQTKLQTQNTINARLNTAVLQQQKFMALLAQLHQLLPQQVHVTKISKQKQLVTLFGAAPNHQHILQLMSDLNAKTNLKPALQEVRTKNNMNFRIQFKL